MSTSTKIDRVIKGFYCTMKKNRHQGVHFTNRLMEIRVSISNYNYGFQCETLRWRQNGRDSVSNHQPRHCLLSLLFGRRSKKTSKLRVTGLCVGNSPGPVNSPHKGPVTRKMFPFDDVIMIITHPRLTSQTLKFGHIQVITSPCFMWMNLLIYALNLMSVWLNYVICY